MIERFEITGTFYEVDGYRLRKHLDIRDKGTTAITPDLMVVMMNPGSSVPIGTSRPPMDVPVETKPDPTQHQIMRVMRESGLQFARVLNLSDIRNQKSSEFYKLIKPQSGAKERLAFAHSVFDDRRIDDFQALFIRGVPVLCAWGVNPALRHLACRALDRIKSETTVGWDKSGEEWPAYYHPLPRIGSRQLEWRERVLRQLRPQNKANPIAHHRLCKDYSP